MTTAPPFRTAPHSRTTLVLAAVGAGLLPLVGNGLYAGDADGAALLDRAENGWPAIAWLALPLEMLGLAALAVLLACLYARTVATAPVAAASTAILGAAMVAVKVGSAAPLIALQTHHEGIDAATAELVVGLNDAAFVVSGFLLSAALTAAGVGLLRTDLPRWLTWWPLVMGALGSVAGVIGFLAPDSYLPVPFLLLLVWMIALGLTTAFRGDGRSVGEPSLVPAQ